MNARFSFLKLVLIITVIVSCIMSTLLVDARLPYTYNCLRSRRCRYDFIPECPRFIFLCHEERMQSTTIQP
ncbi:hypothetical protein D915_008197 [Fasciola hepatica]|uniref:Late nodulin n=1 Tax=Fasciola hepatica TaxID=6192 RepID=A0A4E0RJ85_FASHE|nr:hypothetical protein D915_008197 [Fasciola hepatica]